MRLDAADLLETGDIFVQKVTVPEGDCPPFPGSLKSLIAYHVVISCTKFEYVVVPDLLANRVYRNWFPLPVELVGNRVRLHLAVVSSWQGCSVLHVYVISQLYQGIINAVRGFSVFPENIYITQKKIVRPLLFREHV